MTPDDERGIPLPTPIGDAYLPVHAPMYETFCTACGASAGGGFLIEGWTLEKARADARRYACCPMCDKEGVCDVRLIGD